MKIYYKTIIIINVCNVQKTRYKKNNSIKKPVYNVCIPQHRLVDKVIQKKQLLVAQMTWWLGVNV